MNFYLKYRMRNTLQASEKFTISIISIMLLLLLSGFIGLLFPQYLDQHKQNKPMSPMYVDIVFVFMFFVLPIICTEIILAGYTHFVLKKRAKK